MRVLNPGDGTAANVVFTLSPNSATPQSQRIGDIPPGKEAQFDVELTAQDLGDLQIHGLASADLDLRTESIKTIKVAAAKLEAIFSNKKEKLFVLMISRFLVFFLSTSETLFEALYVEALQHRLIFRQES